ncbi:hypothetical protein MMPV_008588 [Pyropia vietnamensis]
MPATAVAAAVAAAVAPVSASTVFSPTALWHLDRVNQASLPLDGNIVLPSLVPPPAASKFGASTPSPAPNAPALPTVYLLSLGVDATHEVFADTPVTFFDATDGRGSDGCVPLGTLTAGLVAGATVGLAPGMPLAVVAVVGCKGTRPAAVACADLERGLAWVAAEASRRAVVANAARGGGGGVVVLPPDIRATCFASLSGRLRGLWEGGGGVPGMTLFAPAPTVTCAPAASIGTGAAGTVAGAAVDAMSDPRLPPILVVAPTNAADQSPPPPPGCSPPHLRAPGNNITSAYRGATASTPALYAVAVALPGMAPAAAAALAARAVAARPGLSPTAVGAVLAAAAVPVVRVTPPLLLAENTRRYRPGVPLDAATAAAALSAGSTSGEVAPGKGLLSIELRVGIDEAPAWRWLGDVAAAATAGAVPGGTLSGGALGGWAVGHPGGVESQPAALILRVLVAVPWVEESGAVADDGSDNSEEKNPDEVAALRLVTADLQGLAAIVATAVNATPEVSALGATLLGVRVRRVYPVNGNTSLVSTIGDGLDDPSGDAYGEPNSSATVAESYSTVDHVTGARQGVVSGRVVLAVAGGAVGLLAVVAAAVGVGVRRASRERAASRRGMVEGQISGEVARGGHGPAGGGDSRASRDIP